MSGKKVKRFERVNGAEGDGQLSRVYWLDITTLDDFSPDTPLNKVDWEKELALCTSVGKIVHDGKAVAVLQNVSDLGREDREYTVTVIPRGVITKIEHYNKGGQKE